MTGTLHRSYAEGLDTVEKDSSSVLVEILHYGWLPTVPGVLVF